MAKGYRPEVRDQPFLLPPDLREWLPPDDPVWLVIPAPRSLTVGTTDIRVTVRCIQLACENPANRGEFRCSTGPSPRSVSQIEETIRTASPEDEVIENLDSPRVELPEHYYNVKHTKL
jgi:nucleoside-diphosphate-sugar epimerase